MATATRRKMLSLFAAVMLAFGLLAACAKQSGSNADAGGGAASGAAESGSGGASETAMAPKEPYKITIMAPMKEKDLPSDKILKEVEEKTGYKLEFQWVPDGNYEEKLNTVLATNSFPQVLYMKNQATFVQFKQAIRDGQFWEIGPYLKDFPNLSRLNPTILDNTKVDGKLYTLYMGRDLARQGAIYRKDWLDRLNLQPPTNIDELFNLLKAFTENDPDGNGKRDTFGLTDRNDLVYGAFKTVASWFHTPNNWGEKDGQLLPEFMFPQYVQTMDWFKKVRDAGYMNKEFPVTSKNDQRNLFTSGKAGVYIGAMTDAKTISDETLPNFPDAVIDVFSRVNGPDGQYTTWSIPGYGNVLMFPKAAVKTEDDLKQILGFFDQEMTPEIANLMYWGNPGEHYELKDGLAAEFGGDKADLVARDVREYRNALIGEHETNGSYEGYDSLPAMQHATQLKTENLQYMINDPAAALDSPTLAQKGEQLQQIMSDATYQYILGKIDGAGFQAAIENWKKQGGGDVIREINEAYQKSKQAG